MVALMVAKVAIISSSAQQRKDMNARSANRHAGLAPPGCLVKPALADSGEVGVSIVVQAVTVLVTVMGVQVDVSEVTIAI